MLDKIIKTFFSRGLSSSGTVVLAYVLGNLWGAEKLGSYMIVLSMLVGLSLFSMFGTNVGLIKHAGAAYIEDDYGDFKRFIYYTFILVVPLSFLLGIFIYLFNTQISLWFDNSNQIRPVLSLFVMLVPLLTVITVFSTVFKSMLRAEIAPFFELGFINLIFSIYLYMFVDESTSVYDVVFVFNLFLGCFLFISVATIVFVDSRILFHTRKKVNDVKYFYLSLPNMFSTEFVRYIVQWGSFLIVGLAASSIEVGKYSISLRISYIMAFILIVLNTITAPHFSSLYKQKKIHELEALAIKSTLYIFVFSVPVFIALFIYANEIVALAGEEFAAAGTALMILIFGQLVNVTTGSVSFLLNMTGHERVMRNITFVSSGVAIVLCYILASLYGAIGAAISTAFALILENILATWAVYRILNIRAIPGWKYLVTNSG